MNRKSKKELLNALRDMLREALHLREAGCAYGRLARAQGKIDGFMQVLLDAGLVTQKELLSVVQMERQRIGPLTGECDTVGPLSVAV